MEQTPVISRLFHLRAVSLMILMFFIDICVVTYTVETTISNGPSMMIMFGFEVFVISLQPINRAFSS